MFGTASRCWVIRLCQPKNKDITHVSQRLSVIRLFPGTLVQNPEKKPKDPKNKDKKSENRKQQCIKNRPRGAPLKFMKLSGPRKNPKKGRKPGFAWVFLLLIYIFHHCCHFLISPQKKTTQTPTRGVTNCWPF